MKLAFSTLGCPDWSFAQAVESAARLGYQGIEIRGIQGEMRAERMGVFLPGNRDAAKAALTRAGLEMCVFGASCHFDDPAALEENLEEARGAMRAAGAMGIPYVRVFGNAIRTPQDEPRAIDAVIGGIRDLLSEFPNANTQLLLEVHGDFNRADRLTKVIRGVNHARFGILWDVAHSDKVYGDDFMPFYAAIRDHIRHVHIKDHRREGGRFALCHVGDGDIPLRAIVRALSADGYPGYYSLEWEKKWHPELPEPAPEFAHYARYMRALEGV